MQLNPLAGTARASEKRRETCTSFLRRAFPVFFHEKSQQLTMVRRMGAYTQLWGATIVSPEEINGEVHIGFSDRVQVLILWQFLVPWGKIGSADERASNRELEDEVIAYIREQIKDF
jgi:hypothetical protein